MFILSVYTTSKIYYYYYEGACSEFVAFMRLSIHFKHITAAYRWKWDWIDRDVWNARLFCDLIQTSNRLYRPTRNLSTIDTTK